LKQIAKIPPARPWPALALGVAGFLAAALVPADQTVTVGPGMTFTPANVTVVPGETVTWTFAGIPHSTTSEATSGPEFWDSGVVVLTGATFSHTFSTPGSYPYYCSVHSSPGGTAMNGVVQVIIPVTPTQTATPTPAQTPSATAPPVTPIPPNPGNAIPTLTESGLLALGVGIGLTGALLLLLARRP
jgi:plastocyanin